MSYEPKKRPTVASAARSPVRKVTVDADLAGQRIDNFLRRELPGLPKGRIYRALRRGEVRVNGGRIRAEYRLCEGDEVRIPPATVRSPADPPANERRAVEVLERVIFEDKRLLVLNKPSGLAVHGGSGVAHGAIEVLRSARPDLADLSLVHRLDRETSGVLVMAKRRSALRALHELFREQHVEKNYIALLTGDWQHGDCDIVAPLEVRHRRNGERHVVVSDSGKFAETRMRLLEPYAHSSLVQCQPRTGRTHQIRVHAAHAGHAIAGDSRYGDSAENERWRGRGLDRLFLHAQSISFPDGNGNEQHFSAPLDVELDRVLARLRQGRKRSRK